MMRRTHLQRFGSKFYFSRSVKDAVWQNVMTLQIFAYCARCGALLDHFGINVSVVEFSLFWNILSPSNRLLSGRRGIV